MTAQCFVDSNVLVYAFDDRDALKHEQAQNLIADLLATGALTLSAQVLNESYSALTKKVRLSSAEAREAVEQFAPYAKASLHAAHSLAAMRRHQKGQLQFWDALIIESAIESGCATLYSEDFTAGQRYGTVTVRNPFA